MVGEKDGEMPLFMDLWISRGFRLKLAQSIAYLTLPMQKNDKEQVQLFSNRFIKNT